VDRRIDKIFADLREKRTKALMPFVCGGFPATGTLTKLLPELEAAGASIVEIGFPFSDPIADGPVIAQAMHHAIQYGATAQSIFDEVAAVRSTLNIGLVAMVSVSIVMRLGGPKVFCERAAKAGFDGLIIPDVPLEESDELRKNASDHGLTFSLLIAPTSSPARAEQIAAACTGFVYMLARTGITGEQGGPPDIGGRISRMRQLTQLPIACGFGISTADHVRSVVRHADAAIVGSAIVRKMDEAIRAGTDPVQTAGQMVRDLARGLIFEQSDQPGRATG